MLLNSRVDLLLRPWISFWEVPNPSVGFYRMQKFGRVCCPHVLTIWDLCLNHCSGHHWQWIYFQSLILIYRYFFLSPDRTIMAWPHAVLGGTALRRPSCIAVTSSLWDLKAVSDRESAQDLGNLFCWLIILMVKASVAYLSLICLTCRFY